MSWLSNIFGRERINSVSRKARTLRDDIIASSDYKEILRELTQGELQQLAAMVNEALKDVRK